MELSSSIIKKFLIFSYISGIGNPQKFFTFQETETLKSFLYFRKRKFLTFQQVTFQARKVPYILGNGTY